MFFFIGKIRFQFEFDNIKLYKKKLKNKKKGGGEGGYRVLKV